MSNQENLNSELKHAAEELIHPKQAHKQKLQKELIEDRKKLRIADEKIITVGNKKLKKIRYERLVNGKYIKAHTKTVYLGKKNQVKGRK